MGTRGDYATAITVYTPRAIERAIRSAVKNNDPTALVTIVLARNLNEEERRALADFLVLICKRAKRRPAKDRLRVVDACRDAWRELKAEAKQNGEPRPDKEKFIATACAVLAKNGISIDESTLKNDMGRSRKNISR